MLQFSKQNKYDLEENFAKIHLTDWQSYSRGHFY